VSQSFSGASVDDHAHRHLIAKEIEEGALNPWKVMVVDDDHDVHLLTSMVFSGVQFEGREVEFLHAYSGMECLSLLESNDDVAMILLDVVMESSDAGFKVVQQIRDVLDNQLVRIVFRTGQPGVAPEEAVILGYDINDYIAKTEPFSRLLTCVITGLRSYRDLSIRRQYDLAAAMEEHLFTGELPQIVGYDSFAKTQSALQAGGDFYEMLKVSETDYLLALGDVSGKGLPASLYVSATLSMIRAQVECYSQLGQEHRLGPTTLLKSLNRLLLKTLQRGKFVTVFMGIINVEHHELTYATAGHCASYLIEPNGDLTVLKSAGMVCGLCGAPFDNCIEERTVAMTPGSYLMMNSDGLTEATNRSGLLYGDDRYVDQLKTVEVGDSSEQAVDKVWSDVMEHLDFGELSDDCTMLCLKRH
jgi:CheY-like chemotaxis protein